MSKLRYSDVPTGRPPGRPRVDRRMEPVMTRLPMPAYDRLVREALRQDVKVSALVRHLLILRLPKA